jgi:hypothetical protein
VIGPSAGAMPVNIASDSILNHSLTGNMSAQVQVGDNKFVFSDNAKKAVVANSHESNDLVALVDDLFANLDDMPAHGADVESHLTVTMDSSHSIPLTDLNSHCFHFILV